MKVRTWLLGTATAAAVVVAPMGPQVGTAVAFASTTAAAPAWSNSVSASTGKATAGQRPS